MGRSKELKRKRRYSVREIVSIILLISLVFSVVFSFVKFLAAPSEPTGEEYEKVKSDYLLMLVQCSVGLVVMCLPWIVSRKFNVVVPGTICILYYIFLYCAIFLGEVLDFYYVVPHWDTMLHAFSGAMLGALGFVLVDFLNKDSHVKVSLTPFFISLFAFSFALSIGALWEVYEFSFDSFLGLNMQKVRTADGIELIGHDALSDTMKDLIIDAAAAFIISTLGYIINKRKQIKEKSVA